MRDDMLDFRQYWLERIESEGLTPSSANHGSALHIVGKGIANPVTSFWSAAQLLEHPDEIYAASRLMSAIEKTTRAGVLTPDVGGSATTMDVTESVIDHIYSSNV